MALKTYRHPVQTYLILPDQLLWAQRYVAAALEVARQQGKEPKNVKSRSRQLKLHQLCCTAFAATYGLQEQFLDLHAQRLSIWPPDVDFFVDDKRIRIVGVSADETHSFGATLSGKVWENDFARGKATHYILASWFPPYVDFVGWLAREDLVHMKERSWYSVQEANVRPMSTLGLKVAGAA